MTLRDENSLREFAKNARRDILLMSYKAGVGHVPSALSMVDYLSVLFTCHIDPRRDRVVLGKPYGAQAYYAIFAGCGWIPKDWDKYGTPDPEWRYTMARENPLISFMDDTMGNALSVACGISHAFKGQVYLNVSDAYFQAGSVWEAVMYAGFQQLANIVMTVDNNNMQVLGKTSEILSVEPLARRLDNFGWRTVTADGHDFQEIQNAFKIAFAASDAPTAIIMNTEKGHGVSFMTNAPEWHYRPLTSRELEAALEGL